MIVIYPADSTIQFLTTEARNTILKSQDQIRPRGSQLGHDILRVKLLKAQFISKEIRQELSDTPVY